MNTSSGGNLNDDKEVRSRDAHRIEHPNLHQPQIHWTQSFCSGWCRGTFAGAQAQSEAACSRTKAEKQQIVGDGSAEDSQQEQRAKLYNEHMAEIARREMLSSEQFDKAILTLSSAGLGASLTFLADVVSFKEATWIWALYLSWIAFVVAIASTMSSFLSSSKALDYQKGIAKEYYLDDVDDAYSKVNPWNSLTKVLNRLSTLAFVVALVTTLIFVVHNLWRERMLNEKKPSTADLLLKGITTPTMQQKPAPTQTNQTAPIPAASSTDTSSSTSTSSPSPNSKAQ